MNLTEFIGRFHPVVVHLPIGILLLALLLQWVFRKERHPAVQRMLKLTWLLGMASALVAAVTGYLLSVTGDYEDDGVALHMWAGIAVVVLSMVVCVRVLKKQFRMADQVASFVLFMAIVLTGHLGGALTHGPDYLSAAALATAENKTQRKPIVNMQEAMVYDDLVQPVLESKCYSCHGARRQKGKLRVDDPASILKGGKNGPVIVPHTASESEMVQRLLLPKSDKKHMPPKDKEQLNKQEISLLQWWVSEGAPFDKRVKELTVTEEVKAYLASLQREQPAAAVVNSYVPEAPVAPADAKAIEQLRSRGVVVVPVAQNSNYLMVNFITATNVLDGDMKLLLPFKKQLVWLKAGGTRIGDSAVAAIAQCSELRFLQLNNTAITDQSIGQLASLKNLQSLNLVGTQVSYTGVQKLQPLQQLRSLYLFQTKVTREEAGLLQKILPSTTIDAGGYTVPDLPGDTSEVKFKPKK